MSAYLHLRKMLDARLGSPSRRWLKASSAEISDDVSDNRFCALVSLAARQIPRKEALEPNQAEREEAHRLVRGWNPERWTLLETARVALILSRSDLKEESGAIAIEEAFRYADEGEGVALYRSLGLLPAGERFAWRAGEGCRSNMRTIFEAVALDTPYPHEHFDDLAWQQAIIKCIFIEAPLWRLYGLDDRLTPDLARMALDLADERRSAHRPVQPELWLCLGPHAGERGRASLLQELDSANSNTLGRQAAALALGRAGEEAVLGEALEQESDGPVAEALRTALSGSVPQSEFASLTSS